MLYTLQFLRDRYPHLVKNNTLVYETDSQSAFRDIMAHKGSKETFLAVKELILTAASMGMRIMVEWYPRGEQDQQRADQLSKEQDSGDWELMPQVFAALEFRMDALGYGKYTLDTFASSANTKVQSACYSEVHDLGARATNAFHHSWAVAGRGGEPPFAYINPPFHLLGEVLRRIAEDRVDCTVIAPSWAAPWTGVLPSLPVVDSYELPRLPGGMFGPGPRLGQPFSEGFGFMRHARCKIMAYTIKWAPQGAARAGHA